MHSLDRTVERQATLILHDRQEEGRCRERLDAVVVCIGNRLDRDVSILILLCFEEGGGGAGELVDLTAGLTVSVITGEVRGHVDLAADNVR